MPNLKISAMPGLGTNAAPGDLLTVVDVSAPAATANKHITLNNFLSVITRGITDHAVRFTPPGSPPAVSLAAQGSIYFDGSVFQISANGGAYAPLLSLSPQADHAVLIGPTSGGPTAPTWRGLALSDLPAVASNRLLGRVSPLSGDVEEIAPGAGVLTWITSPTVTNLSTALNINTTGSVNWVFSDSPTLTTPRIAQINVNSTRAVLGFVQSGNSVNYAQITNSVAVGPFSTGGPTIESVGTSADVNFWVKSKGGGNIDLSAGTLGEVNIRSLDPNNCGVLHIRDGALIGAQLVMGGLTIGAPLGGSGSYTLPAADGTSGQALTTDGTGVMAWGNVQTFKNLLINGNMQIAQRATSATALGPTNASSGYHTADRWRIQIDQLGANGQYTQSVVSGAGDYPANTVFRKSLKMTCTQAVTSPLAAAAQLRLEQRIESQNLAQVEIGNATAKPLTVSFWVKSNKTGLFVAELIDPNGTQQVSGSFTIAAANTWERHVVTFPANPTGTIIANDNSFGLAVSFWLVAGSNFTSGTLQTAWGNTAADRAAGFASQITALNDYLQITGVQAEIGSTASDYEQLSIDSVFNQCQRYLPMWDARPNAVISFFGGVFDSSRAYIIGNFMVMPRVSPTSYQISNLTDFTMFELGGGIGTLSVFAPSGGTFGNETAAFLLTRVVGGMTPGRVVFVYSNTNAWVRMEGCEL